MSHDVVILFRAAHPASSTPRSRFRRAAGKGPAGVRPAGCSEAAGGALAVKACGAGGGGTLMFYCPPPADFRVARALTEVGAQVLDVAIDMTGLLVW